MFSFVGDTVLDPFLGSGTTSFVAGKLGRNSIGYEINELTLPLIQQRLIGANIDVVRQEKSVVDFNKEIKSQPYVFHDYVKVDKKIDPKKITFGSKIEHGKSVEREKYFTVKYVISPELLVLDNNLKIRLLGIKEIKDINGTALTYLKAKALGQKVFLKYDNIKYDENNNLFCYLYLKNKTFLNAHLIKNKLVNVDSSIEFVQKNKFLNLRNNGDLA